MSFDPPHLSQEDASPMKPNGNAFELLGPLFPTTTSSLDALQTADQRKVLNIVDSLRQCGIDNIIPLPQLVVCGDQSSGKRSLSSRRRFLPVALGAFS